MMRILGILVILCVLFGVGCASNIIYETPSIHYDAGIEAYKRGDYDVALYDFEQRAMAGDPVAQFCLGFMYTHGQGVAKDIQEAIKWYGMAAEQGHPSAQNNIGVASIRFLETTFRTQQMEKSIGTFKTEQIKKHANVVKSNAIQWMKRIAGQGNPIAQYNLGIIYLHGYGVPKDLKSATEWYQKAADQDYAPAQNNLGLMYLEGRGIEKNLKEAAKLFKMAADQENFPAQYNLALRFLKGEGVEKDEKVAAGLLTIAAMQGYSPAQYQLAVIYWKGEGVEKDEKVAAELFKRAAEQGDRLAQHQLALMYYEGNGIPENSERAIRLLIESAQQGYAIAQADFGRALDKQDTEEAYYWYSLAIKDMNSLKFLDKTGGENLIAKIASEHEHIGKMLTEQQRNDIQKQVDNWKPKRLVSAGTGFYISEKHILTNAHVLYDKNGELYDEFRVPYRPVVVDSKNKNSEVDLALLFDRRGRKDTATFRREPIVSGEDVVVFGYPLSGVLSYGGNLTVGTVSGLSGSMDEPRPDNLFQYTAPTQNGNSGGPVLDKAGNVIGVVVSLLNPSVIRNQNVNFAIKFDVVKEFLEKNNITDYASTKDSAKRITREEISEKAKNFTVPVLCFKNIGKDPLPLVEIGIDELNR